MDDTMLRLVTPLLMSGPPPQGEKGSIDVFEAEKCGLHEPDYSVYSARQGVPVRDFAALPAPARPPAARA
jgi:hypothetical protein